MGTDRNALYQDTNPSAAGNAARPAIRLMTEAATPRSGRQHAAATPEARRETSGPIVEARGVVKTCRRGKTAVQALRGTDLVVDRGEMVAVVGRSGSGKTTTPSQMVTHRNNFRAGL